MATKGSRSWAERIARRRGLHALGFASYDAYLESPHWQALRRQVLDAQQARIQRNECELCQSNAHELHIHHKTYQRLGKELVEDVLIICKPCHDKTHGRIVGADPRTRSQDYSRGEWK